LGLRRAHRTGVQRAGRGIYQLEQIPLTVAGLTAIDLKPAVVAGLLHHAIGGGRDLFALPDLRATSRSAGFRHSGPALAVPPPMRSDRETARSLDDQEGTCHD
jgi:hypothetical protein